MTPKFCALLDKCIYDGIARGLRLAYKHHDTPDQDTITDKCHSAVMTEIYEWFDFPETRE